MNLKEVKQWIAHGSISTIESAWLVAVDRGETPDQLRAVIDMLIDADQAEAAHTLTWTTLSDVSDSRPADEALSWARALLPPLTGNEDLRALAAEIHRKALGDREHFEAILKASGLTANQSLRRAIQTLEVCCELSPGSYVANRYDPIVYRVKDYNDVMEEFELVDPKGIEEQLDAKRLADEFDAIDENDFRALLHFRRDELPDRLTGDPEGMLIGICMARGGATDSDALKELLVPAHLPAKKWSSWWSKARAAAKRSEVLSLEGRNPTVIEWHPGGRTLEEELAEALDKAILPAEYLSVCREYHRGLRDRGETANEGFLRKPLGTLARQADEYRRRRPADALAASLALETLAADGLSLEDLTYPSAAEAVAGLDAPAEAIAALPDTSLWPVALDALERRDDAPDQMLRLMRLMPANMLDELAARARRLGRSEQIDQLVVEAGSSPREGLQVLLWLWAGPDEPVSTAPSRVELLSRLLGVMHDVHIDWDVDNEFRRDACQQVRAALTASDAKGFRQAVDEMDEGVARTIKRRVERSDGLSATARDKLLTILREEYYTLFLQEKVDPWLDDSVVYMTEASLQRHEKELKDLQEVQMPANSRAIGAAAELGDLSENGEWQYAIEERRRLEARVAQIQDDLVRARVLSASDVPTDHVGIGSKVALRPVDGGEPLEVTFLGPHESDVANRVFSYRTPLAQAILGREIGETVTVKLDGVERECVVESLASGLAETTDQQQAANSVDY
jgi:transcription elongation GreA/GreB family factor